MIWVVHVRCWEWCLWRACDGDMLLWLVFLIGSYWEDARLVIVLGITIWVIGCCACRLGC
jgi:hypothetical protein